VYICNVQVDVSEAPVQKIQGSGSGLLIKCLDPVERVDGGMNGADDADKDDALLKCNLMGLTQFVAQMHQNQCDGFDVSMEKLLWPTLLLDS